MVDSHLEGMGTMNLRVLFALALLIGMVVTPVSGLAGKYWVADMYPEAGSTTQSILILIRVVNTDPYGAEPLYVYVMYDGACLVKKLGTTYNSATGLYYYTWDITISPPATAAATAYGEHSVTVRLEEYSGEASVKELTYTIVDGAPQGEWYKSLPSGYYAWLRGAKGDTGAVGPQGPQGEPGVDGVSPSIDYAALAGSINYVALGDSLPADVRAELKGEKGDAGAVGAAGRDADPTLTYAALTLGAIACATLIVPKIMKKKGAG